MSSAFVSTIFDVHRLTPYPGPDPTIGVHLRSSAPDCLAILTPLINCGFMPHIDVPLVRGRFGETTRPDSWWVQPLAVFLGFSAFIIYSTWAAFQGDNYSYGPYISPMYSPLLYADPKFAWFGAGRPDWF